MITKNGQLMTDAELVDKGLCLNVIAAMFTIAVIVVQALHLRQYSWCGSGAFV